MKDFEPYDTPSQADEGFDEPQSMSLMGGIAGSGGAHHGLPGSLPGVGAGADMGGFGDDHAGEKKRLTQQSFMIGAIVTVVAFGVLVGMRMTTSNADAATVSAETQQFMADFQSRIANLDKMDPADPLNPTNIRSLFRSTAAIVAAIQDDPTVKQVPLERVQMNPFTPIHVEKVEIVERVDNSEAVRAARLQELYSELARVEVQSLVGGSRARAFIGGELYKVGDTLGSFTVVAIDNRKVQFIVPDFELRDGETAFALGMTRRR